MIYAELFSLLTHIFIEKEKYREFLHLFRDLLADDIKFFKYFKMLSGKFYELEELLDRKKQDKLEKRFHLQSDLLLLEVSSKIFYFVPLSLT